MSTSPAGRSSVLFSGFLVLGSLGGAAAASEPAVDFNRDVRRILTTHCLSCHGPDADVREAGLRLDEPDSATSILESGNRAVVPRDPDASELLRRVNSEDPAERMPPIEHGPGLNEVERATLRRWIEQGASFEEHWSFVPPRPAEPPPVANETWVRSAIDRFVLARLEAAGLTPSEPAEKHRLCRRVALDLTGIPPTIDEADAFANDPDPAAYEAYVDRLLASPAFGERWARVWLDLARYADSQGYAQDSERTIWRYRDWVIRALNDGMPFDQFTLEQIAGDLLPEPTTEQLIATAFHRNTMTNSEGGTSDEEFRNAAIVDRVNTTMEVWMGLSMGCAQCHSHKYDPISQEDYFRFFAILNQTADADRPDESPVLSEYTPEQLARQSALTAEIAELESKVAQIDAETLSSAAADEAPRPTGPLRTRHVRIELTGEHAVLHLAEVQVFVGDENVAVQGGAKQSSTALGAEAQRAADGNTDGDFAANSVSHTENERNPWWEIELPQAAVVDRVVVWNRTDNGLHARLSDWRVVLLDEDRQPVWVERFHEAPDVSRIVDLPRDAVELTGERREQLLAYRRALDRDAIPEVIRLREAKDELAAIKPAMTTPVMAQLPADRQRRTHIQLRGNYRALGDEVHAGFPSAFHSLPGVEQPTRLDLARWLVAAENPLTARVVVNRHWEQLFGAGLVKTSEDFGTQGEPPSHPELLDYLAVELMRHNWDTKWLLREIVTSATYRQSSRTTPERDAADPENRLLARGPRFRLPAEMIRDQALAVAGLLSDKMYGEPAQPERPRLGLRAAFGGSTDWETSPGEDRHRRGVYTRWRRTAPYPSMVAFDAPSREFCTIRRARTNTPLQALVTLNDPVYIEAAQALARRVLRHRRISLSERITLLFRSVLIRPPTSVEADQIQRTFSEALSHFQADPNGAEKLATDPIGPAPEGTDLTELAVWTVLANVVLNLDETLARP